ncbi:MAG: hypothetical protein M3Q24_00505, partial [bacterium]|nr:hypothetical protein [bacterium]
PVSINGTTTELKVKNQTEDVLASTTSSVSTIIIPKSDVIVGGDGYFAFSKDQFFSPSEFDIIPIKTNADADLVEYVLSAYEPYTMEDRYFVIEREFDLSSAIPDKRRLSWVIRAPGLKENGNEVIIKDIQIEYTKKGRWNNKE